MGGLGNQLFIYAAGLQLAIDNDASLVIHTNWYETNRSRQFELACFEHSGRTTSSIPFFDHQLGSRNLPARARLWLARMQGISLLQETTHAYVPTPAITSSRVELRGYFQSWRYFDSVSEKLANQLNCLRDPSPRVRELLTWCHGFGEWAALHVRCGDFLNPDLLGLHGKTSEDYYDRALAMLKNLRSDMPIVVFSDEPECARRLLGQLRPNLHFLDIDPSVRPMDWIYILSRATSVITANSSFSWWGAWLAEQRGAWPVIAPRPWFAKKSIPEQDLLPLTWLTIGREYRSDSS